MLYVSHQFRIILYNREDSSYLNICKEISFSVLCYTPVQDETLYEYCECLKALQIFIQWFDNNFNE